jgi:hypothetical protein
MTFKKLIALSFAASAFLSTSVFAHDDYQLSCDTNISGSIVFANNQLTVKSNKDEDILFNSTGIVKVDGKPISLSKEEQELAQRYYNEVEATIPIVVDITVEALKITNTALTEVFSGLLGENSELPQKLNTRINDISEAIRAHVYQDPNSLTFNSDYLKDDLGLGDDLETEIESITEEIVTSMMGELMISFGKAMLSGDGDLSELEKRMENLGQDIEQKTEVLGKRLEEKSLVLCERIKSIDATETQLRSINALRNLDTIHFNKA